jgi:hypothetical protein
MLIIFVFSHATLFRCWAFLFSNHHQKNHRKNVIAYQDDWGSGFMRRVSRKKRAPLRKAFNQLSYVYLVKLFI